MSWNPIDDIGDAVSDAWNGASEAAFNWWEDIKDDGEDFWEDAQDSWNDAWSTAQDAWDNGDYVGAVVAGVGAIAASAVAIAGNAVDFAFDVVGTTLGAGIAIAGAILGGLASIAVTIVTLGFAPGFARDVGRFIAEGARELGEGASWLFHHAGDVVERLFDIVAGVILAIADRIRCGIGALKGRKPSNESPQSGFGKIDHFFVLMLENRSFDHMLGQSTVPGVDGVLSGQHSNRTTAGATIVAGGNARYTLRFDAPHEFDHVQKQLGIGSASPMGGFISEFEHYMLEENPDGFSEDPTEVMRGFSPGRLPVLNTLAEEFAICDSWFSSVPGPTLTNRQFVHAGTAGGMADSPSNLALGWAMTIGGFEYEHGTVYDRLDAECINWRIYAGDLTPLVLTLKGMVTDDYVYGYTKIRSTHDLRGDLMSAGSDFPSYVFIEPDYGNPLNHFIGGNSQHPLDGTQGGEALIKQVYEAIRASPIWERSVLIVMYDEHGGFYDHCVPPAAVPPGDSRDYESWSQSTAARSFEFDRLGVRVPVVIASPYIKRGTVDTTEYDHTSVLATLRKRFGFRSLTNRDAKANSFHNLFSLQSPRTDTPQRLPDVAGA